MNLSFRADLAAPYASPTQRARVMSEAWLGAEGYCPQCGGRALRQRPNNHRATDFGCESCGEPFELKSGKSRIGRKVVDGAHDAMMARVEDGTAPSLLLLRYDLASLRVRDLVAVPRQFLAPNVLEKRRPLGPLARRRGWVGCNILLDAIPAEGRIDLVRDGAAEDCQAVRATWARTLFLRREASAERRGWLVAVMACVDRLATAEFALGQLYAFEDELQVRFPGNSNVRPKIRQQLQRLRDAGRLVFLGDGRYRRV